jgi:hypothetical protein
MACETIQLHLVKTKNEIGRDNADYQTQLKIG